ncbi:hypothetical protein XENOCAPTIV_008211 [Xenoophorus captivus]|uniref:SPIN-DOC-like zinc-finger domain-containing protein n=1 Tax=Xenoophorus captivus TaxID=1517983 RepID=A0ABV0R4Q4_9TELE
MLVFGTVRVKILWVHCMFVLLNVPVFLSFSIVQTAGLNINDIKCVKATKPPIQSTSPVTSVAAVSSIPEVLVVTTCKAEQSPDALQVKLPIISTEGNVSDGTSSHLTDFAGESSQHCQKWTPRTTETDTASSLPTLKPPDNPLSAIHLHPIECEADFLFAHYDDNDDEDTMSEAVWRNRYLMDYDPLNQLLVCMVCGELQYSHSLDGVRAHINEAHPLTLRLEPREKLKILEAWDEQVSQRERFFSSQLQQHCGPTEGTLKLLTSSS